MSEGGAGPRLPDGCSQIFRLYVFGPSALNVYGSATLRCKICHLATLRGPHGRRLVAVIAAPFVLRRLVGGSGGGGKRGIRKTKREEEKGSKHSPFIVARVAVRARLMDCRRGERDRIYDTCHRVQRNLRGN